MSALCIFFGGTRLKESEPKASDTIIIKTFIKRFFSFFSFFLSVNGSPILSIVRRRKSLQKINNFQLDQHILTKIVPKNIEKNVNQYFYYTACNELCFGVISLLR